MIVYVASGLLSAVCFLSWVNKAGDLEVCDYLVATALFLLGYISLAIILSIILVDIVKD